LHPDQIKVTTGLAGLFAAPGIVGMCLVRYLAAGSDSDSEADAAHQVGRINELRRMLQRLLNAVGIMLVLFVIASEARRRALGAVNGGRNVYPPDFIVISGLALAALLAVFHIAATAAIDTEAQRLVNDAVPIPDLDAPQLDEAIHQREAIAGLLGSRASWFESFQSGVVVLAPLIAAITGIALPSR
jgi:hypothetical protein